MELRFILLNIVFVTIIRYTIAKATKSISLASKGSGINQIRRVLEKEARVYDAKGTTAIRSLFLSSKGSGINQLRRVIENDATAYDAKGTSAIRSLSLASKGSGINQIRRVIENEARAYEATGTTGIRSLSLASKGSGINQLRTVLENEARVYDAKGFKPHDSVIRSTEHIKNGADVDVKGAKDSRSLFGRPKAETNLGDDRNALIDIYGRALVTLCSGDDTKSFIRSLCRKRGLYKKGWGNPGSIPWMF